VSVTAVVVKSANRNRLRSTVKLIATCVIDGFVALRLIVIGGGDYV
jgi:hypothetical protein